MQISKVMCQTGLVQETGITGVIGKDFDSLLQLLLGIGLSGKQDQGQKAEMVKNLLTQEACVLLPTLLQGSPVNDFSSEPKDRLEEKNKKEEVEQDNELASIDLMNLTPVMAPASTPAILNDDITETKNNAVDSEFFLLPKGVVVEENVTIKAPLVAVKEPVVNVESIQPAEESINLKEDHINYLLNADSNKDLQAAGQNTGQAVTDKGHEAPQPVNPLKQIGSGAVPLPASNDGNLHQQETVSNRLTPEAAHNAGKPDYGLSSRYQLAVQQLASSVVSELPGQEAKPLQFDPLPGKDTIQPTQQIMPTMVQDEQPKHEVLLTQRVMEPNLTKYTTPDCTGLDARSKESIPQAKVSFNHLEPKVQSGDNGQQPNKNLPGNFHSTNEIPKKEFFHQDTELPLTVTSPGSISKPEHGNIPINREVPVNQLPVKLSEMIRSVILQQNSGQTTLKMKLQPEHLGEVTVNLTWSKGELSAQFITASGSARDALEASFPQLKEMLAQQNIRLSEAAVFMGQQSGQWERNHHSDSRQSWQLRGSTKVKRGYTRGIAPVESAPSRDKVAPNNSLLNVVV